MMKERMTVFGSVCDHLLRLLDSVINLSAIHLRKDGREHFDIFDAVSFHKDFECF